MIPADNNVAVLLIFFTRTETLSHTFEAIVPTRNMIHNPGVSALCFSTLSLFHR